MKFSLHMSAATGAFEYMLELEPSHSSGADLPIHRSLAAAAGVILQDQDRVRAASTQGRRLLIEVDFAAIIAKIIEQTAALLDADWASVCINDPRSSSVQQILEAENGHACVQFTHTADGAMRQLESGHVIHRHGTCSACKLSTKVDWCASVTLGTGSERVGTLCAMRSQLRGPFADDDLRVMQVFAEWAALAVANAQRLRAAQEIERAERRRIAAHLHDNAAQALTVIGLQLDKVEEELDNTANGGTVAQLQAAKTLSKELMNQIRAAFGELLQASTNDDLVSAIADCVDDFRQACHVKADLVVAGRCTLPRDKQVQAVRIVQEALVNVRRHAQAKSVQVKLSGDAEAIRIIVKDDGAGFDVYAVGADYSHLGTTLMHERAQRSGGFLTLHSLPGRGTEVTVHYPVH